MKLLPVIAVSAAALPTILRYSFSLFSLALCFSVKHHGVNIELKSGFVLIFGTDLQK